MLSKPTPAFDVVAEKKGASGSTLIKLELKIPSHVSYRFADNVEVVSCHKGSDLSQLVKIVTSLYV